MSDTDLAPAGSIAVIGHPTNGSTARKMEDGRWAYTHDTTTVSLDDLTKNGRIIYFPNRDGGVISNERDLAEIQRLTALVEYYENKYREAHDYAPVRTKES